MRNIIIFLLCVLTLGINTLKCEAQVKKNGNTFSVENTRKSTTLTQTQYFFETSEGVLPIYVNKENGRCYVIRTSKKTGKMYNQALKEDICKAVCKELGIKYSYKPKKRTK